MWGEALAGRILRCRKNSSCLWKWQEDNEQYQEPQSRLGYWQNLRGMGGRTLGVLHYLVNLRPRQKARTPRLIPNALRQPLDDRRRLPKRGTCLLLLSNCLIQACQRRLDLPAFSRQAEVCRYLSGLAQVADGLLAVPVPRGQQSPRRQLGNGKAPMGS